MSAVIVIEARKLRSSLSTICNPYVKISLVPDNLERTFCRTTLLRATNSPIFDQKFSFDFLPEDLDKRLLISLWSRDTLRK
ncbi:Regulator of G-protein signaling 3 [Armadillidium vulgare]|nr:Regulator of G-protein signaling 3 [Armadillidium vulgare]